MFFFVEVCLGSGRFVLGLGHAARGGSSFMVLGSYVCLAWLIDHPYNLTHMGPPGI